MYKADFKYSNHSDYNGQKKVPFQVKHLFFLNKHFSNKQISINRHSYLDTMHAS